MNHTRAVELAKDGWYREERNARKLFEESRAKLGIPTLASLFDVTRVPRRDQRRQAFLKEWTATLKDLRDIASRITAYRPSWIAKPAPAGAQADQFLHAFYYNRVGRGRSEGFQKLYLKNSNRRESALIEALEWWHALPGPPSREDEMLEVRLPRLQQLLRQDRVLLLTSDQFSEVCLFVHAIYNHGRQTSFRSLGLSEPEEPVPAKERVKAFASWLYEQKSLSGRRAIDAIYDVLYGGPQAEIPNRIFEAAFDDHNAVPRLGVSSLGEIVGWILPDFSPPRNNRTNKALRALGYDVKVYGES